MIRPAWAASPAFPRCWAVVEAIGRNARTARQADGAGRLLSQLAPARVIVFEAAQVDSLPTDQGGTGSVDWAATVDLAGHLRLPFDPVFLDLGGARLAAFDIDVRVEAVLAADATAIPPEDRDRIGGPVFLVFNRGPDGRVFPPTHGIVRPLENPDKFAAIDLYGFWGGRATSQRERSVDDETDGAERAIQALAFLESVNVDLVDAPLTRAARRKAERKGQTIPLAIQIREPRRREVRNGQGGKADYSHRFEVRGHYMHFTRGPIFEATPPEQRGYVPGIGHCRKVWCPPHVKGPADRPLVPKVRTVSR